MFAFYKICPQDINLAPNVQFFSSASGRNLKPVNVFFTTCCFLDLPPRWPRFVSEWYDNMHPVVNLRWHSQLVCTVYRGHACTGTSCTTLFIRGTVLPGLHLFLLPSHNPTAPILYQPHTLTILSTSTSINRLWFKSKTNHHLIKSFLHNDNSLTLKPN